MDERPQMEGVCVCVQVLKGSVPTPVGSLEDGSYWWLLDHSRCALKLVVTWSLSFSLLFGSGCSETDSLTLSVPSLEAQT